MELKEIATIAGKSGLFRVVKPARNGVIVESLDAAKTKTLATLSNKISILQEISIYTNTAEETISLQQVFFKMYETYKDQPLPVSIQSSGADLLDFLATLVPEFDQERVYPSDVKKLITWYQILLRECPEVLTPASSSTAADAAPVVEAQQAE